MERGKYEQLMYDIWYDELEDKQYQIGTGPMSALTGRGGYVEFHIAIVKKVNEGEAEDTFKKLWEDKTSMKLTN